MLQPFPIPADPKLMVGIPVLEMECTYQSFIRVSSQVVGRVIWDEYGQGTAEGLLQLHERLVLGGDAEIIGVGEAPDLYVDRLVVRVHVKEQRCEHTFLWWAIFCLRHLLRLSLRTTKKKIAELTATSG